MANNLEYKTSPPENVSNSFALKQGRDNENPSSCEEPRNNQTIEVDIGDSTKWQNAEKLCLSRGIAVKKLQTECNKLREELKRTDVDLESYRRTFETVTGELKKQLDLAKKRESESLAKTLGLRLENEKLHVLLESKQNLVDKLRKELLNVKRVLKFAIKGPGASSMFSLCRRYKDEHEHGGTQIKGGYMLRYKRKCLWTSWSEEWVVLYDDSTMAWFKDASGKCMATQKHLVKECPEMLAISTWTGQVPRRPALPPGAKLSQLMALGSRQNPGHVVWMLAKNDEEMKEWMNAISKTLPAPPHIELVMSMPYLRTAFKKPTVRVRPATSSEMYNRHGWNGSGALDSRGLVAVIKRQVPLAGQLGHELAWGQGWGWVTLPNGVWSGRLTWSQDGDDFALHAMPIMHHTNVSQACSMLDGVTAYEASAYEQALAEYDDSGTSDDWDLGVDCGDFMM